MDSEGPTEPDDTGVEEPSEAPRTGWSRPDWIAATAVTVVAAAIRLARLSSPEKLVFDETYYAKDACWYVKASSSICDTSSEISQVHPPLAKWLIAIGIRIFGNTSFGWRISAAVAGTIGVLLLYLLARKLLDSTMGATLASGLLALDFLHFVQSRTSMLDIFAVTFGTAAVLFCVYDRERLLMNGSDAHGPLDRPWRIAAGAAGGAATACKWNGGFFLLLVIVLTIAWEVGARRKRGQTFFGALRRAFLEETVTILLWLVLLPLFVYSFTFIGRLEWGEGTWYRALWDRHKYMFDFHTNLESHHSYESPAWSWLLLKRPVSYFFETDSHDRYKEIFATGNPFVWWPGALAVVYAAFRWLRKRDFRSPEGVIVGGFAATYLLWIPLSVTGRSATFIFYFLPAVPFLCLALAYIATRIGRSWEARAAIALFSLGTIGLFVFYYPLLAETALPKPQWDKRIWIFNNCDPADPVETTVTVTQTKGGKVETSAQKTSSSESLPPPGWCWI
jgi:dolichyl-phosphate-mannose--protein O-mannosyl transferase